MQMTYEEYIKRDPNCLKELKREKISFRKEIEVGIQWRQISEHDLGLVVKQNI